MHITVCLGFQALAWNSVRLARLTSAFTNFPDLQDEVGDALMDFAEAAALAELEDQEQNGRGHAFGHAQQQKSSSQDTRSTETDPGEARQQWTSGLASSPCLAFGHSDWHCYLLRRPAYQGQQ